MRDLDKVEALAAEVTRYFVQRDFRLYASLFHRVTRWDLFGMRKTHKQRIRQQYTVTPYSVAEYSQPQWQIFDTHRFEPGPTHSIQMSLRFPEEGGVEDLYYACAPAHGEYKFCDLVSRRPESDAAPKAPAVIDLAPLLSDLRTVISGGIQSIASQIGHLGIGLVELQYSIDPYPCSVDIYPYREEFGERSWQNMVHEGGEYLHSEHLAAAYRAVIDGSPQLLSVGGGSVNLAQEEFDRQFPDWVGEARFKQEVAKCMKSALVSCLAEARKRHLFAWKGQPAAIVVSYEELKNESAALRQQALMEGIEVYGVAAGE